MCDYLKHEEKEWVGVAYKHERKRKKTNNEK